jgi:hypothetical protein
MQKSLITWPPWFQIYSTDDGHQRRMESSFELLVVADHFINTPLLQTLYNYLLISFISFQWRSIISKHNARGHHVSRLKASVFCSSQKR